MIDIHTIGAGGGSIRAGELGRHPAGRAESAGADPGRSATGAGARSPPSPTPTCCSGASTRPGLLGVDQTARLDRIREIFDKKIGAHLGLGPDEVASAIVRVANDKMAGAIRLVSLQRGHDRATSCSSPSAARARCTRSPWPRAGDPAGAWCRPGPASPRRSAAWWPTCATTS